MVTLKILRTESVKILNHVFEIFLSIIFFSVHCKISWIIRLRNLLLNRSTVLIPTYLIYLFSGGSFQRLEPGSDLHLINYSWFRFCPYFWINLKKSWTHIGDRRGHFSPFSRVHNYWGPNKETNRVLVSTAVVM